MKFDSEDIINWGSCVMAMLETFIETETSFFILLETEADKNWEPTLPLTLRDKQPMALFHIAGDSLMDATINEDNITLRVAINGGEGMSLHDYVITENCRVKGIFEDENGHRGQPIYIMPTKLEEAIKEQDERESEELYSMNHFLKNPNNAKFFK